MPSRVGAGHALSDAAHAQTDEYTFFLGRALARPFLVRVTYLETKEIAVARKKNEVPI